MAATRIEGDPTAELEVRPGAVLWRLAWPAVSLNLLQTVNALLDTFFIQGLPTANATAASGATTSIFLFISLAFALGMASTALVARFYGAGNEADLKTACEQGVGTSLIGGFAVGLIAFALSPVLAWLQIPAADFEAIALMKTYLLGLAAGLPAVFVIQSLAGSLRGVGDTKSPMLLSGFQIFVHIGLNAWMIPSGPGRLGWGIAGAGAAFAISAWVAAIIYMSFARRTALGSVTLRWPQTEWVRRIVRIAFPAAIGAIVRVTSLMAFTFILKNVPRASYAVAALRPAFSVESLAFMPTFGLSIAAAALVGQSLGAQKPERAARVAWLAAHHAAVVSLVASVLIFAFAAPIADMLLPNQPEVAVEVATFLRYLCATEVLFAYAMVLLGAVQGAGDTTSPLWVNVVCMWGLRVPIAAVLAMPFGLDWGARGCWTSMMLTQAVQGLVAIWVFRRGHWKKKEV
ncbi:MAG: MATE family efflux transporter [Fimbriimonadaceae bacterium]